ncbi:MAG: alanine--tRNA ligase [Crocinitomicaceae bacterium]|jgi:alanyl-tRNA synthetase|nr:alanine--tRNA ligase [Crocinitomicaceae bacterium]MBT5401872.1 alanine--tRNA ligase [Crocinitomicaceae bacterium]MBT6030181.1 alanine--tRNA ligase [Crocinitomicaceae bacterium]MBT6514308.1 alanine--tRNA ligase [Crocinitomicaceae bacterium]
MNSKEIRAAFIDFFKGKEHEMVSSAPMVIKNDPTLMFTNAGMNQFKEIFLGDAQPKSSRVCNSQKCLRVSGKHNDLEEVGVDTYHHTMFEMLGNWSFGDYFKKEAIEWSWELLTEVYKIDKSQIYVTIFEGDEQDGTTVDQEAFDIWKGLIAEDRIIKASKKDNFWEMGEMGPCGPCSEIHCDIRTKEERGKVDGKDLVNQDHPQVIEIWNLVFMEYNRKANGSLVDLPKKHVDTGMGFERLCMVLQGKTSNYDTDLFKPIIGHLEAIADCSYGADFKTDIALRVISDHVRAISFSIADGQLPSNTGAGYVIRRILRRAVRYGYQTLKLNEPFLYQCVKIVVNELGEAFPEISAQQELIEKVIKEEESSFYRTLEKGIQRFNEYVKKGKQQIDGEFAFELFDTYGFPIDLTELMAQDANLDVDQKAFAECLKKQKERSRQAAVVETEDWVVLLEDEKEEFVGYDYTEVQVRITRYRKIVSKEKESYQIVFNYTPFYAEGGGQVGDTGYVEANGHKTAIVNTKKENNLIVHFANELPPELKLSFKAVVNKSNRALIQANHTATHLVHAALREVLGSHVEQKGSLVNTRYLRFDFSHFSKLTVDEILKIEYLVNLKIRENILLEEHREIPIKMAQDMGAMALFGEKYGDIVRAIKFGESVELCGGTHVKSTGRIGNFKLLTESSVAAGIRRIECITSVTADAWIKDQLTLLGEIRAALKNPKDVIKAIDELAQQKADLEKEIIAFKKARAGNMKGDLINDTIQLNGVNFIGKKVDLDPKSIKDLIFQLKSEIDNLFIILGAEFEGKSTITLALSDNLVADKDLHAGNIIRVLSKEINGGGGGQAKYATAGGNNPEGIVIAIEKAKEYLN